MLLLNGQEHRSVSVAQDATMPAAAAAEDELETLDRCIDCGVYNPLLNPGKALVDAGPHVAGSWPQVEARELK